MKRTRSVSEAVMAQIKTGQVHMKPRRYYSLLAFVSAMAVGLASLVSAYLCSVLFYLFRIETASTPAWGARARLRETLASFPWWALGGAILLIGFAVWLVRRHGRMYRHRTATLALSLIAASLLLGFALSYLNIGRTHTPQRQNQSHGQYERQNGLDSGRHRY